MKNMGKQKLVLKTNRETIRAIDRMTRTYNNLTFLLKGKDDPTTPLLLTRELMVQEAVHNYIQAQEQEYRIIAKAAGRMSQILKTCNSKWRKR